MAIVKRIEVLPPPPPPFTVVIELSRQEAEGLRQLLRYVDSPALRALYLDSLTAELFQKVERVDTHLSGSISLGK